MKYNLSQFNQQHYHLCTNSIDISSFSRSAEMNNLLKPSDSSAALSPDCRYDVL